MGKSYTEILVGLLLFLLMTMLAVFLKFPYFYSLFVVGLFLLFDGLEHRLRKFSNLNSLRSGFNVRSAFIFLLFILVTDLIAGQVVFKIWYYPHYTSVLNWILLYLVIYPIGGLSLLVMFRVFKILASKEFRDERFYLIKDPARWERILIHVTFWTFPLAVFLPLVLFATGTLENVISSSLAYSVLSLFLLYQWVFCFDIVTFAYHGKPLIYDFLRGDKRVIIAIVVTGIVGATLHEVVNTFAYEWRYIPERLPFIKGQLFGVPFTIFIGWVFMTAVCVAAYRMMKAIRVHHLKHALEKEYF